MARKIQPKEATVATTGLACLVAAAACVLISSVYLTHDTGWPQFALSAFAAAAVCAVGASALGFAAHQQFVAGRSLFADGHDRGHREFDYSSTGQWAVVTGATDGIGKEYARQLAADHGMDVILVGRNPEKLRAVAELISKESDGSGRRVMTVVADFVKDPIARDQPSDANDVAAVEDGTDGTGWYPRLRAAIESPLVRAGGVGVLINCAGVSYPHPEYFAGMLGDGDWDAAGHGDDDRGPAFSAAFCDNADAAVRCNVAAAVHACRLVLPGMLARGRGLVVNVGSASASVSPGAPLMTLYAATKKFLEKLSADLDDECVYLTRHRGDDGGHGVRVQCVRPAYVATAMLRSANPDVREAPAGLDADTDDERDNEDYGNVDWWTLRREWFEDAVERWMVPSARRWVRSALKQGGRLYARRCRGRDGPASFTGYWPHTLLVGAFRLVGWLTPRRWYVDRVLIPGMLTYRKKGRAAIVLRAAERRGRGGKQNPANQTAGEP